MESFLKQTLLDSEFVIFGAGPAGLSAADVLVQSGKKVVVIDRGRSKKTYYSATGKYDLIKDMEVGGIGGATQKWGGQLVRLGMPEYLNWVKFEGFEKNTIDALEFETDQVLEKFALKIPRYREIGREAKSPVAIRRSFIPREITLKEVFKSTLQSPFFQYVEGIEVISLENIGEKVHMRTSDGSIYDLSEKRILIGMGTIENTSLLAKSIPNFSDISYRNLGRNLQDHPHGVLFDIQAPLLTWYKIFFHFGLSRRGIKTKFEVNFPVGNLIRGGVAEIHPLDLSVTFKEEFHNVVTARSLSKFLKLLLRIASVVTVKFLGKPILFDSAQIWFQYEQCLNDDSYLVTDTNGLTHNWTNSRLDLEFVDSASNVLQKYFRDYGFRVERINQFSSIEQLNYWGNDACHPSGTIPVGINEKNSVVDYFGKVHAIPNTNLLGACLFPTSGWFNPTLLIMAYSRLIVRKHLKA